MQISEIFDEMESELDKYGLKEKFSATVADIRGMSNRMPVLQPGDLQDASAAIAKQLVTTVGMINMQIAIVEKKANELFRDYLTPVKRKS